MIKRLIVFLLWGMCIGAYPQDVLKYEYWFDQGYALRTKGTAVTKDIDLTIDVSHLTFGPHLLNFRAVDDNGRWSSVSATYFWRFQPQKQDYQIMNYEFWIDGATSSSMSGPINNDFISLDLDVTSLSDGVHSFTFRAQSSDGRWSAPFTNYFLKVRPDPTVHLTQYEYWFDGDTDKKVTGETSNGLIDFGIDVNSLTAGIHCLSFRSKDSGNRWSAPFAQYFFKPEILGDNKIKGYRYWFNDAYEDQETVTLETAVTPLMLDVEIPTYDIRQHAATGDTISVVMENGQQVKAIRNMLYIQFLDTNNKWSSVQVDAFATLIVKTLIDEKELVILKDLYQSTNGDSLWYAKWPSLDKEIYSDELAGISAYDGHVIAINLKGNNLHGLLPHSVFRLDSLRALNLEDNHLSGTLDVKAIPSTLGELLLAGNRLTTLTGVIPPNVTKLSLNRQNMDITIPFSLSAQNDQTLLGKIPNICLYNHQQQSFTRDIQFALTEEALDPTPIANIQIENNQMTFVLNDHNRIVYTKQSGDTIYCHDDVGNRFMLLFSYDAGDANFDGQVNVLDLQTILNYMFEEYGNMPYNFTASDLWKDEVINVQDAVCLVNMLLDTDVSSARQIYTTRRNAKLSSESPAAVTIENGFLKIISSVPVSAFDITISTDQKAEILSTLNDMGFTCASKQNGNIVHIIGYSISGAEIPEGETTLCKLNSGVITHVMIADRKACEISTSTNGTATGLQFSKYNSSSSEVYRIPLGIKRAIIIDKTGRKTLIQNNNPQNN